MQFLPKTLRDKNDLKRTVNSLILEDSSVPQVALRQDAPPQKALPKKPNVIEEKPGEEDEEEEKKENTGEK